MKEYISVISEKFTLLWVLILLINSSLYSAGNANIGIESISPAGVEQTKDYDITVQLTNYSTNTSYLFDIQWTVTTDYTNLNASLDNKYTSDTAVNFDDYSVANINIGSYTFEKGQTYLIIAKISGFKYIDPIMGTINVDNESNFDTYYQLVNVPYTDIGAFNIDSPSPLSGNTSDGLYATLINYGTNKLYGTYVKFIRQSKDQPSVITPDDTLQSDWVPKYTSWSRQFFVFNPPIDSGDYVQIKVDKDSKKDDVIIVSSWKPNGQSDAPGDDTCRAYFGGGLLGKYSISNDDNFKSQFKDINEALNYLYNNGFYTDNPDDAIVGFGGGVQFYTRPGTYKGSVKFDGIPENGSLKNTITLTTYSSDSTQTIIEGDSGTNYALLLNNMQFMALKWFTINASDNGNVIKMSGSSKNFVISASVLNAQSSGTQDKSNAVIYCDNNLDSCSILNCSVLNGSYGVYYNGSDVMSSVGVSHCNFSNQSNVAISMYNTQYSFIIHNTIYNNRMEFVNSKSPLAINNRVFIDSDISALTGQGYQSLDTKSGILMNNCTDTLSIVGNNICVKVPNTYSLHLKDCNNQVPATSSVVNNNSFQSIISAVYLENVNNLFFSKVSANMTGGKSNQQAGVFMDNSCKNIAMARNAFNNSGGGYAMILGSKSVLLSSNRDNLYSSGSAFVNILDHGEFSDLNTYQNYMGFDIHNRSTNLDPQFYEDCDLISCNSEVNDGYQQCNRTDAPNHFQPADNSENHPLNVQFYWGVHDSSFAYWLQVSTSPDFGGKIEKNYDEDDVLSNDKLIFNTSGISLNSQTVYSLQANTQYYWRVRVCCGDSRSEWSETTSFKTGNGTVNINDNYEHQNTLSNLNLKVYPNPINNNSILEFDLNKIENVEISVLNYMGYELFTKKLTDLQIGKNFINVNNLYNFDETQSIYFIRLKSESEMSIIKTILIK